MRCYIWLFFLLTISPFQIYATATNNIPETLKPWINWVLDDNSQYQCPFFYNTSKTKYCAWPGQLTLDIQAQQGQFSSDWQVYNDSFITLPGSPEYWPQDVSINDKPAVVISRNNKPTIELKAGHHQIEGTFFWDNLPNSLTIPEQTGIISVSILNKPFPFPIINMQQLWFKTGVSAKTEPENRTDQLNLQVYRQVYDSIPLQLITHLSLEVSGSQREIKLPYALLKGFIPISLNSKLPARLEPDGSLLVQVRAGLWNIELTAQYPSQLENLKLDINDPQWPATEIWSFAAQPQLRVVKIENLQTIDPSQSNVPTQWKKLPAFLIKQQDSMQFKIIRRGDPQPEPNNLSISRNLWLDFAGTGYTVQDRINGSITHGWRLDSLAETQLGQVQINGQAQLITRSTNNDSEGVELRKGRLALVADSRIDNTIKQISATGWQETFNHAKAILHLPPGWHLFAVSGVDNVPNSWLTRWTLLDLFLVLIAALAVSRLWNNYWGLFALCTLALIWHETNAPRLIWLNLLAAISLIKVIPQSNVLRFMKFYRSGCWLALLIISVPFLIAQVRIGLYPQLEKPRQSIDVNRTYQQEMVATDDGMVMKKAQALASSAKRTRGANKNYYPMQASPELKRVDPDASLQTGPGLPQWQWTRIPLSWNGSVDSQQQIRFWYLGPKASLLLNFLRVILVVILSLLMLDIISKPFRFRLPAFGIKLGLLLFLILPVLPAHADYPSPALLKELKQRLLKAPDCLPDCAQIASMQIDINKDKLTLTIQAHAQEKVALPLPAKFKQWLPNSILVDNSPAKAIIRDKHGLLWLALNPGIHKLTLTGATPLQSSFTLPLPLKPHFISSTSTQWKIEGLKKNGLAENQLHFSRIQDAADKAHNLPSITPSTLPAFIRVERTLNLGLDWHINTRIIRASKEAAAVAYSAPS